MTATASSLLPTSIPAHRSITAGIWIIRLLFLRIEQPAYQLTICLTGCKCSNPGSISASRTRLSNGILDLQIDYRPSLVRGVILLAKRAHFRPLEWPPRAIEVAKRDHTCADARSEE